LPDLGELDEEKTILDEGEAEIIGGV